MGINGLWSLLTPVARPIALETLANKRLAVDASMWMYHFQMAVRDKKTGDTLQGSHIMGTFRRIVKLLYHGVKPVFVFDGDAPMLKKRTIAERKRRKAGAATNHARTAQQLLSAQLRAAAAEHAQKRQKARGAKAAAQDSSTSAPGDTGDIIDPKNVVYLEDLEAGLEPSAGHSRLGAGPSEPKQAHLGTPPPVPSPKKKYVPKDQYALPKLDGSLQSRAKPSDTRLASEAELREFIEDMRPEDFDINSDFFGNLPVEIKYEIIGDLRIKSRQVNHRRVEQMRQAPTALDFSRAQITNLMQRNSLTQKLFDVTDTLSQASIAVPTRVAGSKNREYVLVKQDVDKGGGWVLGVRNPEITNKEPIVIDATTEESVNGTTDDEQTFEEIPAARKEKSPSVEPEVRRALALEAVRSRYAPTQPEPDYDPYLDDDLFASGGASLFGMREDEEMDEGLQAALMESARNATASVLAPLARWEQSRESPPRARTIQPINGNETDDSIEYVDGGLSSARAFSPAPASRQTSLPHLSHDITSFRNPSTSAATPIPENIDDDLRPAPRREPSSHYMSIMDSLAPSDSGSEGDFEEVTLSAVASRAPAPPLPPARAPLSQRPPPPPLVRPSPPKATNLKTSHSRRPPPPAPSQPVPLSTARQRAVSPQPSFSQLSTEPVTRSTAGTTSPVREPSPAAFEPSTFIPSMRKSPAPRSAPASNPVAPPPAPAPAAPVARDFARSASPHEPPVASTSRVTLDGNTSPPPQAKARVEANLKESLPEDAMKGVEELEDTGRRNGHASEEEFFEWEKSPTPPPRERSDVALFRPPEDEDDKGDFEDEEQPDFEREMEGYADMVSRLNNRSLADIREEAERDVTTLTAMRNAEQRNADGVTRQMASDIKELLQLFGIPYVDAPQEAEAECAELLARDFVDGIITDDSDIFLFGGGRVYRHMFNDNKYVECYLTSDLERELGLDRDKLIRLAYLLGGDYADGVPGIGPVLGRELLEEFTGATALQEFKGWWTMVQKGKDTDEDTNSAWRRRFKKGHKDLILENSWPDPAIANAYYHPSVNTDDEPFSWAGPDLDGLRTFLRQSLSWGSVKVDEIMLPLIKRQNERKQGNVKHQGNLGDYFDVSGGSGPLRKGRIGYASERLQNVVKNWRKNQQRNASTAPDSDDEEPVRPPPPKRKKSRSKSISVPPAKDDSPAADSNRPVNKAKAPRRPPKTTAASRKKANKIRRDARAAARGGVYSSEDEGLAEPPAVVVPPQPRIRARRLAANKRPIVDEPSDDEGEEHARKKRATTSVSEL